MARTLTTQQEAALVLLEQTVAVRDSARAAYDEAVLHAHQVGCTNAAIGEVVGQGESAVRQWLTRRAREAGDG